MCPTGAAGVVPPPAQAPTAAAQPHKRAAACIVGSTSTSAAVAPPSPGSAASNAAIEQLLAANAGLRSALASVQWDEHGRLSKGSLLQVLRALGNAKQPAPAQDAVAPLSTAPAASVLALSADSVAALDAATSTAAAAAPEPSSCALGGGSRGASLRPSLSIDISVVRVSDSSSDGADGDGSGAAPGSQQAASPAAGGKAQHTSSRVEAQHTSSRGGEQQQPQAGGTRSSRSNMSPAAASSEPGTNAGGKKRHCPTPGVALHQPPSIFSGSGSAAVEPPAASSSGSSGDDDDNDGSRSDGTLVRFTNSHLPPGSSYRRPAAVSNTVDSTNEQQHPTAALADAEPPWHHTLSERPSTPGVSLGQPLSIFSGSGGSVETGLAAGPPLSQHQHHHHHRAAPAAEAGPHLVHFDRLQQASSHHEPKAAAVTAQGGHARHHAWHHPPTPGVCLGQPVSIFSSSGGQDAAGEPEQHSGSEGDKHNASEGDNESSDSAGHVVQFRARPCSAPGASAGAGQGRLTPPQQQQQQPAKHSRRLPTPGGALGRSVSHSSSSSDAECAPAAAQEHVRHSSRGRASASAVCFQGQPGSSKPGGACSTGEGGRRSSSSSQAQLAGVDGPQHTAWRHKLSERPPTPGVSLAHPVSIFSGSGGSLETGLAAEGGCGHEALRSSNCGSKQLSAEGSRRVSWGSGRSPSRQHLRTSTQQPPVHQLDVATTPHRRLRLSGTMDQQAAKTARCLLLLPDAVPDDAPVKQQPVQQQQHAPTKSSQQPKALLARLSPELAAEVQHQHSQRPPTPGATLGHNMFSDDDNGAASSSTPGAGRACAAAPRVSKVNADVAADIQQQHWKAKLGQRPPTPGALLGAAQPNIFAAIAAADSGHAAKQQGLGRNGSTGSITTAVQAASRSSSMPTPAAAGSSVLLKHSPDLAAEVQQQRWQARLATRPPTPGASLGPVSIFADDADGDSNSIASDRPQQPVSRDRSPDLVGSGSDSNSSLHLPVDRTGSANPGRWRSSSRGGSPLRGSTTAADVAASEAERHASPLRQSSSMRDPDPARLSPLRVCHSSSEDSSDDDGGDGCSGGAGQSGAGGVSQLAVLVSPTASAGGSPTHVLSRLQRSASPADRDPSRGSPLGRSSSSSARPTTALA